VDALTNEELAAQWVRGLSGDWSILAALASPTVRVWHSHDNLWLTSEESQARMAESGAMDAAPSFQDVRAIATPNGFVVQGWIEGPGGGGGRNHIVQICTVEDGRIAACEEYIAPEMPLG
jgi:ketosteroid isomerase-like protein